MEHHFHAAVLLGLEGLIEIGTASEIGAAVGDKEGRLPYLERQASKDIAACQKPELRVLGSAWGCSPTDARERPTAASGTEEERRTVYVTKPTGQS